MPWAYGMCDLAQTMLPCLSCEPDACLTKSIRYPRWIIWPHAARLNEVLELVSSAQQFSEVFNYYFYRNKFMFNIKYVMTLEGFHTLLKLWHSTKLHFLFISVQWHLIALYKLFRP